MYILLNKPFKCSIGCESVHVSWSVQNVFKRLSVTHSAMQFRQQGFEDLFSCSTDGRKKGTNYL